MKICVSEKYTELGKDLLIKRAAENFKEIFDSCAITMNKRAKVVLHFCDPLLYKPKKNRINFVYIDGISETELRILYTHISEAQGYITPCQKIKDLLEKQNPGIPVYLLAYAKNNCASGSSKGREKTFNFLWTGSPEDRSLELLLTAWQNFSTDQNCLLTIQILSQGEEEQAGNVLFKGIGGKNILEDLDNGYKKADAIIMSDTIINSGNETIHACSFGKPVIYPRTNWQNFPGILTPTKATSYSRTKYGKIHLDCTFSGASLALAMARVKENYILAEQKAIKAVAEINRIYSQQTFTKKLYSIIKNPQKNSVGNIMKIPA